MSADINFHFLEGKTKTSNSVYTHPDKPETDFVVVRIESGDGAKLSLFLRNLEDVDRLAFEFENLTRTLREEYGWKPNR